MICPECNGNRWFYSDNGPAPRKVTCDACDGAGEWEDDDLDVEPVAILPVLPGRITDLLLQDRQLTPAEWAEIDAAERAAGIAEARS